MSDDPVTFFADEAAEHLELANTGHIPLAHFVAAIADLRLTGAALLDPTVTARYVPPSPASHHRFLAALAVAIPELRNHCMSSPDEARERLGHTVEFAKLIGQPSEVVRERTLTDQFDEMVDHVALLLCDLDAVFRTLKIRMRAEHRDHLAAMTRAMDEPRGSCSVH